VEFHSFFVTLRAFNAFRHIQLEYQGYGIFNEQALWFSFVLDLLRLDTRGFESSLLSNTGLESFDLIPKLRVQRQVLSFDQLDQKLRRFELTRCYDDETRSDLYSPDPNSIYKEKEQNITFKQQQRGTKYTCTPKIGGKKHSFTSQSRTRANLFVDLLQRVHGSQCPTRKCSERLNARGESNECNFYFNFPIVHGELPYDPYRWQFLQESTQSISLGTNQWPGSEPDPLHRMDSPVLEGLSNGDSSDSMSVTSNESLALTDSCSTEDMMDWDSSDASPQVDQQSAARISSVIQDAHSDGFTDTGEFTFQPIEAVDNYPIPSDFKVDGNLSFLDDYKENFDDFLEDPSLLDQCSSNSAQFHNTSPFGLKI